MRDWIHRNVLTISGSAAALTLLLVLGLSGIMLITAVQDRTLTTTSALLIGVPVLHIALLVSFLVDLAVLDLLDG